MKKTIILAAIIMAILVINKGYQSSIPKESIRFRIIANSNNENDQQVKKKIIQNISQAINTSQSFRTIEETREYIVNQLPTFEEKIQETLKQESSNQTFEVHYGKNYFPQKAYEGEIYPEGEYESLVITLGEGEGNNFWCVLFPPLCFLDQEEVEYKSFIKEFINKYF